MTPSTEPRSKPPARTQTPLEQRPRDRVCDPSLTGPRAGTRDVVPLGTASVEVIDLRVPRPSGTGSDPDIDSTDNDSPTRSQLLRRTNGWDDKKRAAERRCLAVLVDASATARDCERATHELVQLHSGLVEYIARKFKDRGEPLEDLRQVGMLGLLKAAQRFDPGREVEFSSYATVTVTGEIKRHFRDRTWAVHMPRQLQELRMAVSRAHEELSHRLGTPPTVLDVAGHLGISEADVIAGQRSALAYAAVSLEALTQRHDGAVVELGEFVTEDSGLRAVELRRTLVPALQELPEREYTIVTMHYFQGCSQSTIAAHLGISQMHVSRLLARALTRLRMELTDPELANADKQSQRFQV